MIIMTKYIIYTCLIAFALLGNSCSFLDENPTDRLVTKNFYTSQKDAQAAVDATYQQLNSLYQRSMYLLCDLPADDMKNGLGMPNAFLQNIEYLRIDAQNTFVQGMWTNCYAGIMKANAAINNIPGIVMNTDLKERYISEAKFLRALYYFNLVRFFGDVPLITKLDNIDDAMGPRVSTDQVYQQIIQDLSDAENNLPLKPEYRASDAGRVTKGAAKILLAKVYLTKGDFQGAKDKLAEVVENETTYGFGLHAGYGDNWSLDTEAGIESVLYVEYKPTPLPFNDEMGLTGPKYSISGTIGVAGSNEADIPTQELYDAFKEKDLRKAVNFRFDFTNPKTGEVFTSSIPLFGKYWQDGILASNQCEVNMHIIRYSDALLMYAEALNEIGNSEKAHQMLNRVRERAFGDNSENVSGLSKEAFRAAILNERRLEFPLEGHRWFDLVRTGTFLQRMKEHSAYEANVAEKNKADIALNLKEYMILMPIPQREIDLNTALIQNTGW